MDARADCVLIIGGYDVDALKSLVAGELGELETRGASPDRIEGFYRCAYSLRSKDLRG
jgi:hypothetical protein